MVSLSGQSVVLVKKEIEKQLVRGGLVTPLHAFVIVPHRELGDGQVRLHRSQLLQELAGEKRCPRHRSGRKLPDGPPILWMDELHHLETTVETIVCIFTGESSF